jgi:RNA polymerase sigma-70 factor, ECF subfamily
MTVPSGADDLIRRAQDGEVRAFEQLVEHHIPQIRRFARAFAESDPDADDLAQEALIKVYRALGSYRRESAFSTWLFAITRNAFLDATKALGRRQSALRDVQSAAPDDRDRPPPADELLEREQDRRRLWAAIQRVPEEYRTAIVLMDIEGLSCAEVARIEGVPVGTVKSRASRGREHLRRLLDEPASPLRAGPSHLRVVRTQREGLP